jgi:metal-responsive CopG/Arc/MetJ family transcriptional regulator
MLKPKLGRPPVFKTTPVAIAFNASADLLKKIDKLAESSSVSRSEMIRVLLEESFTKREK